MDNNVWDSVVIGGGFYGCVTALYLKQSGHRVIIIERENDLLQRASYANQARVHNGYHYPRSFMTAWRSLTNFPRFVMDFKDCIDDSFEKVYAIARNNSKVNAFQFQQFCKNIGAPMHVASDDIKSLFNEQLIEEVFIVKEYAFNAVSLKHMMQERLDKARIPILFGRQAQSIHGDSQNELSIELDDGAKLKSHYVFNCTYAQLNTLMSQSELEILPLKHQISEITLIEVPDELKHLGITIMDGPFFSVMPFPAQGVHSFSHVRYTHHEAWYDHQGGEIRNPYKYLQRYQPGSYFPYMLRDAQRYLPLIKNANYVNSLYEIKTLLIRNDIDDGRPILFRQDAQLTGLYNVLGSKIDNIFDLLKNIQIFIKQLE